MPPENDKPRNRSRPMAAIRLTGRKRRRRGGGGGDDGAERASAPRLRKLRLLLVMSGLAALALVSTIFGMMMAVASDLPQLDNRAEYRNAANSFLYDDHWRPIGLFAPPNDVVIDKESEIAPTMKDAVIAIEDRRFMTSSGVDFRGIARAFIADFTGGSRQGASTIPEQFVKNALEAQNNRTIFEKLREAALAYHLTRKWSKGKILTEYLNSIYFGNGAYGVESAARVYFGKVHGYDSLQPVTTSSGGTTTTQVGCGDGLTSSGQPRPKCASVLTAPEAALLAGMVASPSAFNPIANPIAARDRRSLVLKDMLQQGYITATQYTQGLDAPLPRANDIQHPVEPTAAPYFTSWLRPQILAAMGYGPHVSPAAAAAAEYRAYFGGLKIRTTLDLKLQQAAEQAVSQELPSGSRLPTASLVAIDNRTGEIRAMVGGPIIGGQEDYRDHPFNLATQGQRQPGSAFKPFTLAAALMSGEYSPESTIDSAPQNFIVPGSGGKEHFIVHNFGNTYSGPISLAAATAISDNSVYAQVGIHVGTKRVAALARRMGVHTPLSTNYAMILGGLKEGVTPLEMAHAYETFATGGKKVFNSQLGAPDQGPTGIAEIQCPAKVCGHYEDLVDHPSYEQVLPPEVAKTVHDILVGVVARGTGTAAAIPGVDVVGKTGTTSNYADAWFVGWTPQMTTAVWVGYPDKLVPMATDFNGGPVEGGTYPAIIWRDFMTQALSILANEQPKPALKTSTTGNSGAGNSGSAAVSGSSGSATSSGPGANSGAGNSGAGSGGGTARGSSGSAANGGGGAAAGNSGTGASGGSARGTSGSAGGGSAGNSGSAGSGPHSGTSGSAGGGSAGGGSAGGGSAGNSGTSGSGGGKSGGAGLGGGGGG